MTHPRLNALSLAVAVAINSSIAASQALADRRLQIKSVDIPGNGRGEFTHSEVMVRPTLGHDQQPIPKSFTTTYPDQALARAGYDVPSEGFTDVLSGIDEGVSSIDQFETDEHGVAQKYTKILKVGNEGVFRFTHNLEDSKLIIEVRGGMTNQDSVEAVCSQSGDIQPLEPLTKVANPKQLVAILKVANKRAGSLGEIDHYVALATIEVDKVEVNGRTFMRLIAAGDQPLELKHLGQSLFVNDEALFAAATTAYTRVHVLREDLQQMALNNLLSYLKPVGYVVHAEDETQTYPVPAGYPKLAVTEAPGEIIVFRGQKQNPSDIAFVQMVLYHLLEEFYGFPPATEAITKIKTDKVKSYQYVIRNRQTALLEELAAQHNAGLNEDGLTTREDILVTLAYYESFQQALTSATQDSATQDSATQGVADEFEFSIGHVRVASSVMTPTWMYNQLLKHFGFKPELKDLLSNRHFVQNIHELIPIVTKAYGVSPPEDGSFASKVIGDFAGQTLEMASKQDPEVRSRAIQQYLKRQIPGLDLSEQNEGITTEDHNVLKARLYNTLLKNAALEEELKDIRTPGHPKAMPEVLRILRAAARTLGKKNHLNDKDDVYFQRQVIANLMHLSIREARRVSELKARIKLQVLEKILTIKINKGDDKATRLQRIRAKIDGGDVSYHELSGMYMILRPGPALEADLPEADIVLSDIHDRLNFIVEESDQRAEEQQLNYLTALEMELNISPHENPAAQERDKIFMAQLARALQLGFADDANLFDQQHVLRDRIQELMEEVNEFYDDEGAKRIKNNQIADQLNIKNYRYHGSIDEQNSLIEAKLEHLDEEVFKAGQPDVDERIAAIEHELDKQMARLGPKPRFDLHRDVARAKRAIKKAESNLSGVHRKLNNIRRKQVVYVSRTDVYPAITDEDEKTLNQAIKQIQIDYDLPADDGQTTEERVDDIRHFLRGDGTERRDEVLEKLEAASKHLNLQIQGDLGLMEEADYFIAIASHANTNDPDEAGYALGELPLTRQKYTRVKDFLRVHDRKSMELTHALREETNVKEHLALKKKENTPSGEIDEKAEALHNNEIAMLNSDLEHKSQAVAESKKALEDLKEILESTEEAVGLQPDSSDTYEDRVNALRNKQIQLGGNEGTGGMIRQLIQQQVHLQGEIEIRKADIERMKEVLKAAEEVVESDIGPFQFTPKQAEVLNAIHKLTQQHPLKKQALETAIGLAELAEESVKTTSFLASFDFDDEFAPIRLQAMIGEKLTFTQASRIVEVFKCLKAVSPESQPLIVLKEVHILSNRARRLMATGAQEYDDEILGMGKAGIHHVEYEPKDLKSFSEYFTTHSASGNTIIALLGEGLISKIELENYIKAVRDVDGYQTVAEFEHFLGYKHGVKVPEFRKVVQMLSDEGTEKFMQSAFTPVTVSANGPAGMKESVVGMKEYAAAVIANYVLDDIAFENGRRTAAFLTHVQNTLTPYTNAVGLSESDLIKAIHGTLTQAHAAAVERQLNDYWVKPSVSLAQIVTWYFSSYKPLLVAHTTLEAAILSLSNMSFLYLLDLTNRGDYTHRMLTPFQHWLERYGLDLDRTRRYAFHREIEQLSEVGGLAMPLCKAASSVILLRTGTMLFARQHNANPRMYRSISRLVPEIMKSMASRQGVQVPLLHRITPEKVKTLASATAGLVLGPVATVGAYAHGLLSGFTYAQTFGFALASSLTFDFFMNDNKMLTQWLGGPLGRGLDKLNRWRRVGETESDYVKRTVIATPQRFKETDEEYANRIKTNNMINGWMRTEMHGWTRNENYLQLRERRDRTMKMYEHGWEKYFRDNVPKWSFSHAESIPYSYTLGTFYEWQHSADRTAN